MKLQKNGGDNKKRTSAGGAFSSLDRLPDDREQNGKTDGDQPHVKDDPAGDVLRVDGWTCGRKWRGRRVGLGDWRACNQVRGYFGGRAALNLLPCSPLGIGMVAGV